MFLNVINYYNTAIRIGNSPTHVRAFIRFSSIHIIVSNVIFVVDEKKTINYLKTNCQIVYCLT